MDESEGLLIARVTTPDGTAAAYVGEQDGAWWYRIGNGPQFGSYPSIQEAAEAGRTAIGIDGAALAREFAAALWVLDELDVSECFIDGTFTPAKAGGTGVGKTKRGKGSKVMVVTDRAGLPVSAHVTSAQPHEVTLGLLLGHEGPRQVQQLARHRT